MLFKPASPENDFLLEWCVKHALTRKNIFVFADYGISCVKWFYNTVLNAPQPTLRRSGSQREHLRS